jgi:hypothetical protein
MNIQKAREICVTVVGDSDRWECEAARKLSHSIKQLAFHGGYEVRNLVMN